MRTFGLSARPRIVPSDAVAAADGEGAGAADADVAGAAGADAVVAGAGGGAGGSAEAGIAIAATPRVSKPRATYLFTCTSILALGPFRAAEIGCHTRRAGSCARLPPMLALHGKKTLALLALAMTAIACRQSGGDANADAATAASATVSATSAQGAGAGPLEIATLLKDYKDDAARADAKYKGKHLRVSGVVADVRKGEKGGVSVTLGTGAEIEGPLAECFFTPEYAQAAATFAKGLKLTVEGDCEGLASTITLRRCGFGSAATANAAPPVQDGKGAMDVCTKLEAAGLAAKCSSGTGPGERARFDLPSLPGKSGLVVRLADPLTFSKYVAGVAAQPQASPLRPYYGSPSARIVVHLTSGVTPEVEEKMKVLVDAL